MAVLERGGNAFDAAVATGLTLQVVEPHLNGPGRRGAGDRLAGHARRADRALRPGRRARGGDDRALPRAGPRARPRHGRARRLRPRRVRRLAAAARGVRNVAARGRARVRDRLRRARLPARRRHPRHDRPHRGAAPRVARLARPLPAGAAGRRSSFATRRSPRRTAASSTRRAAARARRRSRRARRAYYEGFVAEEIDRFSAAEGGLLTGDDMARWRATLEPVATLEYRGLTVCKTRPWGGRAGRPAAARAARRLRRRRALARPSSSTSSPSARSSRSPTATRSTATRDVPLETLLSPAYNDERRALIGDDASERVPAGHSAGCRASSTPRSPRAQGSRRAATPSTSTSSTAGAT